MTRSEKFIETNYPLLGLIFLVGGAMASFVLLPFSINGDGAIRYQFMSTLVHQMQIVPMRYSMVGPLFSFPLWLISGFFKDPAPVIARYNFVLFICALLVLFAWLKGQFDRKFLLTFGLILSFGSMFPNHLINYYGEVFSAVCLTLGTVSLVVRHSRLSWAFLILAVLNTPALLVAYSLVVLYMAWEAKQLRYLLLILLCILLMVGESYLRTGSILAGFQTYLDQDHGFVTALPFSGKTGYSYPFGLGFLSILFSFGKGIIFYCPGLLLFGWAWKHISNPVERKLLILWFLIVLGLILAYSSWWAWYGGWFWGPRFFLFACIPASWMLARLIHTPSKSFILTLLLPFLLTLSLWVGVNGVVFQQQTLDICTENNYALESLCWYVPEFSALVRPFITHAALLLKDKLILIMFASIWLYTLAPTIIDLFRRLKLIFQANHSRLDFSGWKF